MKLFLLSLLCVALWARTIPEIPNSWSGTVEMEMPMIGKLKGKMNFDYPHSRTMSEFKMFGTKMVQLDDYTAKKSYQISMGSCQPEELEDSIYPTELPPFAVYVGQVSVRGEDSEHWRAALGPISMNFYVLRKEGREFSQLLRFVVDMGFFDFKMDIYDMEPVTWAADDPLFDPAKYGCPPPPPPVTFSVSGYALDGSTASGLANTAVHLKNDKHSLSVETGSQGIFSFSGVHEGVYELQAVRDGYFPAARTITVDRDIPTGTDADITMSKKLDQGSFRAVLNWDATPLDLDLHLQTPFNCKVYFSNKVCSSGSIKATLDIDRRYGYGPETIAVVNGESGKYEFFVHNWSNESPMTGTGAVVVLYDSTGEIARVAIRDASGSGRMWHVGDYEDGLFTEVNTVA